MRHLMNPMDFSVEELDKLFDLAADIEKDPKKYAHMCEGKKLATCFYEPSTRTRLSFESAMINLGGSVIGFSDAGSSSAAKGESVSDTIRVISCFADICAMRHPKEGAPMVAASRSGIPVINAGDGGHQHPTQTLTDLLTIRSLKGRLDNFTIGICGDLKFGRTVHSLVNALARYDKVHFVFISPEELRIPSYLREMLWDKALSFEEVIRLIPDPGDPSFPSGHVTNSIAPAWAMFLATVPGRIINGEGRVTGRSYDCLRCLGWKGEGADPRTVHMFSIAAVILSVLIGVSRLYLGVHFPTDVLGGFIIGMLAATIVYNVMLRIEDKRGVIGSVRSEEADGAAE